jgi:hyperosmotically inducible protein
LISHLEFNMETNAYLYRALGVAALGALLSLGAGAAAQNSDTAITASVKARLADDAALKASHIDVKTSNGDVTLKGTVDNVDAKTLAINDAKQVQGVASVENDLRLPGTSESAPGNNSGTLAKTKRAVSDTWITSKVKSKLLADSPSKALDVSVKTTHGVVALKGTLPDQNAADHVKDIAQKVNGVKSVDTSALTVATSQ